MPKYGWVSIKAIIETLKEPKKSGEQIKYAYRKVSEDIYEVEVCYMPVSLQSCIPLDLILPDSSARLLSKAELEKSLCREQIFLKQLSLAEVKLATISQSKANYEQKAGTRTDAPVHFQYPEHPQLQEIFRFIETNYHQPISLNEMAKAFGYSPSYLTSLVGRLTGQTAYQWIIQRRMFQARRLLLETDLAVHEVAEAVGYVDTGYFIKHFRQLNNITPKTWRNTHRRL